MSIQEELNQIKSAVYGADVRSAIHDSIKKAYDDASANGNANMEVEMARGTESTLNDRLGKMDDKDAEVTAQLAQTAKKTDTDALSLKKADKDYVDEQTAMLSSGTPKIIVQSITDLPPVGGTEKVALVKDDDHKYFDNGTAWVDGGVYQGVKGDAVDINVNKTIGVSSGSVQSAFTELGENTSYAMQVKNEITNGNFDDILGWIQANADLSVANNQMSIKGTGVSAGPTVYKDTEIDTSAKSLFGKIKLTVNSPNVTRIRIQVRGTSGGSKDFYDISNPPQGELEAFGNAELDETFSGIIRFYIVTVYNSVENATAGAVVVEKAVIVDLTKTFGSGYEPKANPFSDMLSRYPAKFFDGITGPLLNYREFNDYYKSAETKLKAYPKTMLQYEVIKKNLIPISVGYDGGVYGMRSESTSNAIHRTYDGYETSEAGFDFSNVLESGDYIAYVCHMPGGYVVVISNSTNYTAKVFHSTDFNTGFTKVLDIPNGMVNTWATDAPVFDFGDGVLLLSEYAQDSTDKYVYITYDGGATWAQLIKNETVDVNERSHWHSATFDSVRSRIYVSQGDMANTKLKYTDDFGSTWNEIVYDLATPLQPTVLPVLNDTLVYSPDRSAYPVSLWTSKIDQSMELMSDAERFEVAHVHTVSNLIGSHKQFGGYPVMKTANEMIMSFTDRGANNQKTFFAATGDGGNTFHNVFTFDWSKSNGIGGASRGIVGYDKNGLMYIHTQFDGEHRILKCQPLEWIYK